MRRGREGEEGEREGGGEKEDIRRMQKRKTTGRLSELVGSGKGCTVRVHRKPQVDGGYWKVKVSCSHFKCESTCSLFSETADLPIFSHSISEMPLF